MAAEQVPSTARVKTDRASLPGFFGISTALTVAGKFRDIVEGLEPGIHQFFPVAVLRRTGEAFPGQFHLVNVLQKADAIIVEKSEAMWRRREVRLPDGRVVESKILSIGPSPELTLDRTVIAGRHLWRGDQHARDHIFFSDALMERVQRAGLKKLRWFKTEEA